MTTANGLPLLSAVITERITGAWMANNVDVDSEVALSGRVVIESDGAVWIGTATTTGTDAGRAGATIVGGAGGLSTMLSTAKWYGNGPRLLVIIDDLLRAGGEILSPTSDAALLATKIPRYGRRVGTVGQALTDVTAKYAGGTWRVLRDGTVWVGVASYTAAEYPADTVEESRNTAAGIIHIAPGDASIKPGDEVNGERFAQVVTVIDSKSLRQSITLDGHASGPGQFESAIDGRIARVADYTRTYSAVVTGQSGNRIDVMPDDVRIRGNGITGALFRHGILGATVTLVVGTRCLLGFENGDPSEPWVGLWPDGSAVQSIQFGGGASPVALAGKTQAALNKIVSAIQNAPVLAADGGATFKAGILAQLGVSVPDPGDEAPPSGAIDTDVSSSLITSD